MNSPNDTTLAGHLNGVARLSDWGVIRAQGEDAAKFLHGQLTQDVVLLGLNEARLAAFCSAKGRMLASFSVFKRANDDIVLICPQDILTATLKRLSMFVLRAKVKLTDASNDWQIDGLLGDAVSANLGPATAGAKVDLGDATGLLLPPAGTVARALYLAPAGAPPLGAVSTEALWRWGTVRSGVVPITAPVVDAYVPQMLNYESVGGVNFQKGCYPGQEVVARSQFRGTLKRRGYIAHADAALTAGLEVFHDSDPTQPCGSVAYAAPSPTGGCDAVVSLQTAAVVGGQLSAGTAGGPVLTLLPLPYALRDDI